MCYDTFHAAMELEELGGCREWRGERYRPFSIFFFMYRAFVWAIFWAFSAFAETLIAVSETNNTTFEKSNEELSIVATFWIYLSAAAMVAKVLQESRSQTDLT